MATVTITTNTTHNDGTWLANDDLVVNNGAVYTINATMTKIIKTVVVNNGKVLITNSSTTTPLAFLMGQNQGAVAGRTFTLANGLAQLEVTGNWISVGTGTGIAGQVLTLPYDYYIPYVWVETASGSGVYEKWLNLGKSSLQRRFGCYDGFEAADSGEFGKVFIQSSLPASTVRQWYSWGQMFINTLTFGNGVAGSGNVIPLGANVRVPNIVITDASPGAFTDATFGRVANFVMSGGGRVSVDKALFCAAYFQGTQAQSINITNTCFAIAPQFNECYSFNLDDVGVGPGVTWPYAVAYTERTITASSVTSATTTATFNTAAAHGFETGQFLTIAGATPSAYNGTYAITVTGATSFTYTFAGGTSPATGTITAINAKRVASITSTGTACTLNTNYTHRFATGDIITIAGASPAAYNGTFEVTGVASTSLTYTSLTSPGSSATGTITYTAYATARHELWIANATGGNRQTWNQLAGATINKLAYGTWHPSTYGAAVSSSIPLISLSYCDGITITNSLIFQLFRQHRWCHAIGLQYTVGATLTNNRFLGGGVWLNASSNNTVSDTTWSPYFGYFTGFGGNLNASFAVVTSDPATRDKLVNGTRYYARLVDRRMIHVLGYDAAQSTPLIGKLLSCTPYEGGVNHPLWFGCTPANNAVVCRWGRREPAPASGTRYEVYRSLSWGSIGSVVSTISTLQATAVTSTDLLVELFNDTTVTNGNTYFYTLRKYDSAGVYTDSAQIEAVPSADASFTNLILQSEDLTNASWVKNNGTVVTTNIDRLGTDPCYSSATSLFGDRVDARADNSSVSQTVAVTAGNTYTFSVILYLDESNRGVISKSINIQCEDNGSSPQTVTTACEVTKVPTRFNVTITASAAATSCVCRIGGSSTFNKDTILIAGAAQFRLGSTPGPYVGPTTTTSLSSLESALNVATTTGATATVGGIIASTVDGGQQIQLLLGTASANGGGTRWRELHVSAWSAFEPNKTTLYATEFVGGSSCDTGLAAIRLDAGSNGNVFRNFSSVWGGLPIVTSLATGSSGNRFINVDINMRGTFGNLLDVAVAASCNNNFWHDCQWDGLMSYPRKANYTPIYNISANNTGAMTLQNVRSDTLYSWPMSSQWLNTIYRGVAMGSLYALPGTINKIIDPNVAGVLTTGIDLNYVTVYDYIFNELYETATTGSLTLLCNASSKTIKPYTIISGTPTFQNDGTILFGDAGDSIEWEWNGGAAIKGVSGFRSAAIGGFDLSRCYLGGGPVPAALGNGTNSDGATRLGCIKIEYAIDTGSGYGALKRLTDANLTAESVSATSGFKLKVRMTAMRTIPFATQSTAFVQGETINGQTSGATAVVDEIVDSGTTGQLWVSSVTGTWGAAENIRNVATVRAVTAASPNQILPIRNQAANNSKVAGLTIFTNVDQSATYPEALVTYTLAANVSLAGAEIRIYDMNNVPTGSLGTELSGIESNPGSTYSASLESGNVIWVQVMLPGYVEYGQQVTVPSVSSTTTLILTVDSNA